ncbi:MAG: hypothetical protein CBB65_14215 [Hyphomonadaceae bacterium TMED5]|nr:hypothetical protein [Ponticaulis sp.]OUX97545.1 MAG: hypothetical protein CBB65_14215 [Hyphomonadaceae bacterium TMED5]|tara:strand:- start:58567 stop:59211 length:645 start_codon:yes stop_codon:yes gene_type:complete
MTIQAQTTENLKMSPLNSFIGDDLADSTSIAAPDGLNVLDASAYPRARHLAVSPLEQSGTQIAGWTCFSSARGSKILLPDLSANSLPNDAPSVPDGYVSDPAFRNGYWIVLFGSAASAVFKHGCEIDLRPSRFTSEACLQTVLFHTSVTIIRHDLQGQPAFHLFGCSSFAHHIHTRLSHLHSLYGGGFTGLEALRHAMKSPPANTSVSNNSKEV